MKRPPRSWRQGCDAAWRDEPVSACPYRPGTPEHLGWVNGWSEIVAAGASGVSPAEKAALGLAPTPTKVVGFGDLVAPHPNWSTGATDSDVEWFRPEPEPLDLHDHLHVICR